MKYLTIDDCSYTVGDIVHIWTADDRRNAAGLWAPLQIFVVAKNEEMDSLELCRVSSKALSVLNPEAYRKIRDRLHDRN